MVMRSFLVLGLLLALQLQTAAPLMPVRKRAAYFMDNDENGNNIVALKINPLTGLLSSPVRTPTGGKGRRGTLGQPPLRSAGPDSLFTQDAVVVHGKYLFAVNPGSNTLSMFCIPDDDPYHPTLVGCPADTLGEFPVSVAYSSKLKIACVLNGGAIPGVACYDVHHRKGLIPLDKSLSLRSISGSLNQTTPPRGPLSTASDILFNPSSTALFVVIKGTGPPTPGTIYAWPVVAGQVSRKPVVSTDPEFTSVFGMTFLRSDTRLMLTAAAFGAFIGEVSAGFKVTAKKKIVVQSQNATCWIVYAPKFDSVYVVELQRPQITVVNPGNGEIKGYLPLPASALGGTDSAVYRSWLYVLAADASVLVFDLSGSEKGDIGKIRLVQKIDLRSLGSRKGWVGMAIFS